MKVTAYVDVLSHWCLAAWPAVEALGNAAEIVLAPVNGGAPMGYTHEQEAWYYRRGSLAYGESLRADWCEGPDTGTLHANAAVLAAARLGADMRSIAGSVMRAAMREGRMFGRRGEVAEYVAALAAVPVETLRREMESPAVFAELERGNARLSHAGCVERPSFTIENANGDRAVLQGVWHSDAILATARALAHDESAYVRAETLK